MLGPQPESRLAASKLCFFLVQDQATIHPLWVGPLGSKVPSKMEVSYIRRLGYHCSRKGTELVIGLLSMSHEIYILGDKMSFMQPEGRHKKSPL